MSKQLGLSWIAGMMVVVFAAGCGSAEEGTSDQVPDNDDAVEFPGDDGKADSITPQGDMGYLSIVSPDVPDGVTRHVPEIRYRNTVIDADVKYRIKPGTGCIELPEEKICGITIEKGKHTQYLLSGIQATWQADLHQVDVGPMPHFIIKSHGVQRLDTQDGIDVYLTLNGEQRMAVSPLVLLDGADEPVWNLAPGEVVSHSFEKDLRTFVRLVPPVREAGRPPEVDDTLQYNHHWLAWVGSLYSFSEPTFITDAGPMNDVGEFTQCTYDCPYATHDVLNFVHFELDNELTYAAYKPDKGKYIYATNNSSITVSVKTGETQTIDGQHIDILDAIVEDGTGGTATYPATYSVYGSTLKESSTYEGVSLNRLEDRSWQEEPLRTLSSPSGLDLVPGIYNITTKFTTPEGELEKRYKCTLISPSVPGESRCELTYEQ